MAYVHHDLLFPIVHHDIISSNILLNVDFESKFAYFGITKDLQVRAKECSSTTIIVGTYGYLLQVFCSYLRELTRIVEKNYFQ